MDNTDDEILNSDLMQLANYAEKDEQKPSTFDVEPEPDETEEVTQAGQLDNVELKTEAAQKLAAGLIGGSAWVIARLWGVEHDEKTKAEGVEKLTPCFQRANMPEWLVYLFGRYGVWLLFGGFVVMTGVGTYAAVQERKEKEQNNKGKTTEPSQPVNVYPAATGGRFTTAEG